MDKPLAVWTVHTLELEGQMGFLESEFVVFWNHLLALPPDFLQNLLNVDSVLIHQSMSLFEPNPFYRVQVIAARQNTSNQ